MPTRPEVAFHLIDKKFAHSLKHLVEFRGCHFETRGLPHFLTHRQSLVLAPATLAALPSTRAIPDRDVFYVAQPRSFRSLRFFVSFVV